MRIIFKFYIVKDKKTLDNIEDYYNANHRKELHQGINIRRQVINKNFFNNTKSIFVDILYDVKYFIDGFVDCLYCFIKNLVYIVLFPFYIICKLIKVILSIIPFYIVYVSKKIKGSEDNETY